MDLSRVSLAYRPRTSDVALPKGLLFDFSAVPCIDLTLQDVKLQGDAYIKANVIENLNVVGLQNHSPASNTFAVESGVTRSIAFDETSFGQLVLKEEDRRLFGELTNIRRFRQVSVQGNCIASRAFLDGLTTKLHSDRRSNASDGNFVRSFLVQLRKSGMYTDNYAMGPDVLFNLMQDETRRIYAGRFEDIVEWTLRNFTGYGIRLQNALRSWCIYTLVLILIVALILGSFRITSWKAAFSESVRAFLGNMPALPAGKSKHAYSLATWITGAYRFLLALQLTLLGVFVQNAIIASL